MVKNKSSWDFYGVKIIKQIIVTSEPDPGLMDELYDDNKQFFEESIILVRAQSFNHAYKVAIKKATEYEEPYTNIYGQQVLWKFIEAVDCYIIYGELKSGTEIYSCFHSAHKNETANEFLEKWLNQPEGCRKARHR